jgi:hypothetical protein
MKWGEEVMRRKEGREDGKRGEGKNREKKESGAIEG